MIPGVEIVKQEQVMAQDGTGAYVPSVRVTFRVDGQGPFSVEIARDQFSLDNAKPLIENYAAHVRAVGQAGGA